MRHKAYGVGRAANFPSPCGRGRGRGETILYNNFLKHLESIQEGKINPGLDRIRAACRTLGNPQDSFKSIHIAGTNGKGSTAAFIESILRNNGYKVGLYTSPHLKDVRERIQIDRKLISKEDVGRVYSDLCANSQDKSRRHYESKCHSREGGNPVSVGIYQDWIPAFAGMTVKDLSYFELLTLIAFIYFKEQKVDFAVLETGLGGRWDATNVVTPEVSVITKISLDHQAYLGDSIASIVREKCGIIKKGVPVVIAKQTDEVTPVILNHLSKMSVIAPARRKFGGRSTATRDDEAISLGSLSLPGRHQIENAATALEAVNVLKEKGYKIDIKEECFNVNWAGRLQKISNDPEIILDAAHNPDGAHALAEYLKENYSDRKIVIIFGAMKDKDYESMIDELGQVASAWVFFQLEGERASKKETLASACKSKNILFASTPDEAIKNAKKFNFTNHLIVVTGSIYLIAKLIEH